MLGTGVNPGFVMDALPITLTGVCERVEAIRVDRIQDARIRRLPFQQKIGAGLTREQFQKKVDDGQRAARRPDRVDLDDCRRARAGSSIGSPTRSSRRSPTETVRASSSRSMPGYVCGIDPGRRRLPQRRSRSSRCTWRRISARPSRTTRWRSTGSPALKMKIAGGVHGDIATASIVVNSMPKILEVPPGLHTMRDMPIPSFFGGRASSNFTIAGISEFHFAPSAARSLAVV